MTRLDDTIPTSWRGIAKRPLIISRNARRYCRRLRQALYATPAKGNSAQHLNEAAMKSSYTCTDICVDWSWQQIQVRHRQSVEARVS